MIHLNPAALELSRQNKIKEWLNSQSALDLQNHISAREAEESAMFANHSESDNSDSPALARESLENAKFYARFNKLLDDMRGTGYTFEASTLQPKPRTK